MSDFNVEIIDYPTGEDWARCKMLALNTIGKKLTPKSVISHKWKRDILRAEHSPIRTLRFLIRMTIPYFVSNHFARHKICVEHYVQSQRDDRQDRYNRYEAKQSGMVMHIMDLNAQELMNMSRVRLCNQADAYTKEVMSTIVSKVLISNPEFSGLLVPKCCYQNKCNEMHPCGFWDNIENMGK